MLSAVLSTQLVHIAVATNRQVPSVYPTIQSAIDASKRGDIIQVAAGDYPEHLIVDVVELTITGAGKATTFIDAQTNGIAMDLQANGITVTGFTIKNGGRNPGITSYTYGGHTISNNIIANFTDGIYFVQSDSNTISGNTFLNNSMHGINLSSSLNNQITSNSISQSAFGMNLAYANNTMIKLNTISGTSYGIYLSGTTLNTVAQNNEQSNSIGIQTSRSDHLTISNNTISGGMYTIQFQTTHYSQISNNTLTQASYGIYLAYSNYNSLNGSPLPGNLVAKNDWGLVIYNSTGNQIINGNTFAENTWGMYITSYSSGNTIHHNNFVSNVRQAVQDLGCTNTWDNGAEGNYWNDYTGYPPASGVDYHPLSQPWPLRNLATIGATVSKTISYAYSGNIVVVSLNVKNLGAITETFQVTAYYNSTPIGTQTTTLAPNTNKTLTYNWNTTTLQPSSYIISGTAQPIPYIERDYTDNTRTAGTVQVRIAGDANGDKTVDVFDILVVKYHRSGPPPGPGGFDPTVDINADGNIDVFDILIVKAHLGQSA